MTSEAMKEPFFWFSVRIGDWKWECWKFYHYVKKTNHNGRVSWMNWERVYLFGPPPDEVSA